MVRWGYRCGEDAQRKVPCSRRRVEVHRQLTTGDADLGPWPRSCLPGLSSTNLPFSRFPTLSSVFGRSSLCGPRGRLLQLGRGVPTGLARASSGGCVTAPLTHSRVFHYIYVSSARGSSSRPLGYNPATSVWGSDCSLYSLCGWPCVPLTPPSWWFGGTSTFSSTPRCLRLIGYVSCLGP